MECAHKRLKCDREKKEQDKKQQLMWEVVQLFALSRQMQSASKGRTHTKQQSDSCDV